MNSKKKTNVWVLDKAGVKRVDTVEERKLAYWVQRHIRYRTTDSTASGQVPALTI